MQGIQEKQSVNQLVLIGMYELECLLQKRKWLQQKRKKFDRSVYGRRLDSKAPGKPWAGHHTADVETGNLITVGSDRHHESERMVAIVKHQACSWSSLDFHSEHREEGSPRTGADFVSTSASSQDPVKNICGWCISEDVMMSLRASFPLPCLGLESCLLDVWKLL